MTSLKKDFCTVFARIDVVGTRCLMKPIDIDLVTRVAAYYKISAIRDTIGSVTIVEQEK
jgi:hypothetical protein